MDGIGSSKMQVRFKVYGAISDTDEGQLLDTFYYYDAAEDFCWKYSGPLTLYIMKVWVSK